MAELPSAFWSGWVAVITTASLMGVFWLIYSVYFAKGGEEAEEPSPVWDGNLQEGEHPAPLWWFWLIFGSLVISVIYLMLYPGLGAFRGALNWSQGGEVEQRLSRYQTEFGPLRRLVAEGRLETLQDDAGLMASAQRIYNRNCAVCHGDDAGGQANLFPSLNDAAWQWGGEAAQIEHSIRHGRLAVMVGWEAALGEPAIEELTDYTLALRDGTAQGHPGEVPYMQYCAACHGADGTGNPMLGAPNLTDDASLYGQSRAAIRHSIAQGRSGEMPAFGERLDDTQIRLLVAWLTRPPGQVATHAVHQDAFLEGAGGLTGGN